MSNAGQIRYAWRALVLALFCGAVARAQGSLSVTPSVTVNAVAGTGVPGYSGDGASATSAQLRAPRGAAYDSAGDLFIADTGNNVVRKVAVDGLVSTVAGSGVQGFGGDGGPAVKAELNGPAAVAVAADGTLFIADTGNRRVRAVAPDGNISTVAGTGAAGSTGDEAAAVTASFRRIGGLVVDSSKRLFVADEDDHRVRMIDVLGKIHAYAGNGRQGISGAGGSAVDAELDDPASMAVDGSGRLLVGDRRSRRVLRVNEDGTLQVLATLVSGSVDGVAVNAAADLLVANGGAQTILRITDAVSGREAGNGEQQLTADGAVAAEATFDRPAAVVPGADGSTVVVQKGAVISRITQPVLEYPAVAVGASAQRDVTLTNTGTGALAVNRVTTSSGFAWTGGSCGAPPILLGAGKSCVAVLEFSPSASGAAQGSVVFSGDGFLSQTVRLHGSASGPAPLTATTTTLSVPASSTVGSAVSLTARVFASGPGSPSGSIEFFDGATTLTTVTLSFGQADYSLKAPALGSHTFTATYSGDARFAGSASVPVVSVVGVPAQGFILTAGASSSTDLVAAVGAPALFQFQISGGSSASSAQAVTFAVNGAPQNVTIAFDPDSVVTGPNPSTVLMTVRVNQTGALRNRGWIALGLLLPVFVFRRRSRRIGIFAALTLLVGCATGNKGTTTASKPLTQSMTLVATAKDASGATTVHTLPLTLTIP